MPANDDLSPEALHAKVAEFAAPVLEAEASAVTIDALVGHASARRYFRVKAPPRRTALVMVLPDDALKSEEVTGNDTPEELPFVNVHRQLVEMGMRVPTLHRVDLEVGMLVLEDLGDETLDEALGRTPSNPQLEKLYGKAVDTLAFFRYQGLHHKDPDCLAYGRAFDETLLRWELDHFLEYGLEAQGHQLTDAERAVIDPAFDELAQRLAAMSDGLTHRDWQSRNLMLVGGELAVIDFQDALLGPMVYDLVALLRDSYRVLPADMVDRLKDRYLDAYRALGGLPPSREDFDVAFDLQTVQRKLKDAGRFVFIDQVKGNPSFLPSIPASLAYVREAMDRLPELGEVQKILAGYLPELAPGHGG